MRERLIADGYRVNYLRENPNAPRELHEECGCPPSWLMIALTGSLSTIAFWVGVAVGG
jgi:hypothetical protein